MKTRHLLLQVLCGLILGTGISLTPGSVSAQVKIGDNPTTINAGSVLELESTDKGLLMPRISLTNTTTWGLLGTPAAGMHVYNTNNAIASTNGNYPTLAAKIGEYYWDGTGWVALAPVGAQDNLVTFSVSRFTNQTLPVNTATVVDFVTTEYDKGNVFDLATNQATLPVGSSGYYQINGYLQTALQATGQGGYLILRVNGTNKRRLLGANSAAGAGLIGSGSGAVYLQEGDVLDFTAIVAQGATLTGCVIDVYQISK